MEPVWGQPTFMNAGCALNVTPAMQLHILQAAEINALPHTE